MPRRYYGVATEPDTGTLALTDFVGWLNSDGTNFGYVYFYDINSKPAKPDLIGYTRVTESGSGIPMRVAIMGKNAYIATINVGLQIVDVDLSKKYVSQNGNPPEWSTFTDSGKSITGVFDTINGLCGNVGLRPALGCNCLQTGLCTDDHHARQSHDHRRQLAQSAGLAGYIKPTNNTWHAAASANYTYIDNTGASTSKDIAFTTSRDGSSWLVLDITNPASIQQMGIVRYSKNGTPVTGIIATDVVISKQAKLAYASSGNVLYVIDLKDPTNPILLNQIGSANDKYATGGTLDLGNIRAIAEQDGWVYLADQKSGEGNGMEVVDLDPFTIKVVDINNIDVKEIKYARDGSTDDKAPDKDKVFMIKAELDVPCASNQEAECAMHKIKGTVAVQDENKKEYYSTRWIGYKAKCDLTFKAETNALCVAR